MDSDKTSTWKPGGYWKWKQEAERLRQLPGMQEKFKRRRLEGNADKKD